MAQSSFRFAAARQSRVYPAFALLCAASRVAHTQQGAVVVNASNAIEDLSTDKLRRLYLGQTRTFPSGGHARLARHTASAPVPYAMHEDVRLVDGDPYFAADRFRRETLGIRYEYAASAVLKMELRSLDRRAADRATELGIQLGLAF